MFSKKPTVIIAIICCLIISISYYYFANQNSILRQTERYQLESDLQYKSYVNKLKDKKAILMLLAKQIEYDKQFNPIKFSKYLSEIVLHGQFNEICLTIPLENFSFSTKKSEVSDCKFFNELLPNQVISDDNEPKLILSEYLSHQNKSIYISIISNLNATIKNSQNPNFDQYFLIFDSINFNKQYFSIINGSLKLSKRAKLTNSLKHQIYNVEKFDNIQLLYLTEFKKTHLLKSYNSTLVLVSLVIFLIGVLVSSYIIKLLFVKKETEDQLQLKETEIAYSQKFLSLILENLPQYVFVKDQEYKVSYANQNFLNLYPESQRDKVIGYTTFEQFKEAEKNAFLELDIKAFNEGYSETLESITFPNGNKKTLHTVKVRFTGLNGNFNILGISNDVTDRELLLKNLERSNEELQQFSYRVSHDLKSPLLNIQTLALFVKEDIEESNLEEAKKNLDKIDTQASNLFKKIMDMLALTKADYINDETNLIDFNDLITQAIIRLEDIALKNKIKVLKHIDKNIKFYSSKIRLTQIFENLLSNSIKYYDPDKKENLISIRIEQKDNEVVITFEDNGIGLPEGKENQVFDLFTRFNVKKAEGSGLGLAIVKKHVEKLNGTISAYSVNNATFFIIRFLQ